MQKTVKIGFVLIASLIVLSISIKLSNQFKVSIINDCKVKSLVSQPLISSEGTTYRYLVITDKETFICQSSLINSKFDNSNIFFNLAEDSTYSFKVEGYGKSLIFDYRNILEIIDYGSKK